MSGYCGWIGGAAGGSHEVLARASRMAALLGRPDHVAAAPAISVGRASALAGVGVTVVQLGAVRMLVWGTATLDGAAAGVGGPGADWIAIWRTHGARSLCERLRGAFALCLVDDGAGEAVLATDRLGTFPLLYRQAGEVLAFASAVDCLDVPWLPAVVIEPQAIYDYVYFHVIPAPASIYRGVQRLAPGSVVAYRQGRVTVERYWQVRFDEGRDTPFADLRQEFLDLLRAGVRRASDGEGEGGGGAKGATAKVGAFLSGGTDSSTLAGMLAALGNVPAQTYSIGFAADGYDEMAYARLASRHFGTEHHEYYVTADDVVAAVPLIARGCDQPFGNASIVPAYYCARMAAADGVTRLLGGDGGDELFGGNERYARQQVFALYGRVPALLRERLLEPALQHLPGARRVALLRKARSYVAQARVPMPARLETYNLLNRYGPSEVFTPGFLATVDTGMPLAGLEATYARSDAGSLINRMLALDLQLTLADNDLPKVRRACDLAGVEAVFPFLDHDMVAFSTRLRPRDKLRGRQLRHFFKQALADFLPPAILQKPKHGFGLPFGVWLQQHQALRELAGDSLESLRGRRIVRGEFLDQLLDRHMHEHAGYHGTMVWVLMMLEQWFQQHRD